MLEMEEDVPRNKAFLENLVRPNWVVQLVTLRRGEANSVPRRGPERAHRRDHQPNQERDRLLHRLLQSGVEARRHGAVSNDSVASATTDSPAFTKSSISRKYLSPLPS
jgi:hypothetical protein